MFDFLAICFVLLALFSVLLYFVTREQSYEQALEEQRMSNDDLLLMPANNHHYNQHHHHHHHHHQTNQSGDNNNLDNIKHRKERINKNKLHNNQTNNSNKNQKDSNKINNTNNIHPNKQNVSNKQQQSQQQQQHSKNIDKKDKQDNKSIKIQDSPIIESNHGSNEESIVTTIKENNNSTIPIEKPVPVVEQPVQPVKVDNQLSSSSSTTLPSQTNIVPEVATIETKSESNYKDAHVVKTNNTKKNKKSSVSKSLRDFTMNDIIDIIKSFTKEELTDLTDHLLTIQANDQSINDLSWHTKNDPVESLRKQLTEKEELINTQRINLENIKRLYDSITNELKQCKIKLSYEHSGKLEIERQKNEILRMYNDMEKNYKQLEKLLENNRLAHDESKHKNDTLISNMKNEIKNLHMQLMDKEKMLNELNEQNKLIEIENRKIIEQLKLELNNVNESNDKNLKNFNDLNEKYQNEIKYLNDENKKLNENYKNICDEHTKQMATIEQLQKSLKITEETLMETKELLSSNDNVTPEKDEPNERFRNQIFQKLNIQDNNDYDNAIDTIEQLLNDRKKIEILQNESKKKDEKIKEIDELLKKIEIKLSNNANVNNIIELIDNLMKKQNELNDSLQIEKDKYSKEIEKYKNLQNVYNTLSINNEKNKKLLKKIYEKFSITNNDESGDKLLLQSIDQMKNEAEKIKSEIKNYEKDQLLLKNIYKKLDLGDDDHTSNMIEKLSKSIEHMEQQISSMKLNEEKLKNELKISEDKNASFNETLENLGKELKKIENKYREEIHVYNEKLKCNDEEIQLMSGVLKEKQDSIIRLESESKKLKNEIIKMNELYSDEQSKALRIESDYKELIAKMEKLEQEIGDLKKKNDKLKELNAIGIQSFQKENEKVIELEKRLSSLSSHHTSTINNTNKSINGDGITAPAAALAAIGSNNNETNGNGKSSITATNGN